MLKFVFYNIKVTIKIIKDYKEKIIKRTKFYEKEF
jgi:hypothetical protein